MMDAILDATAVTTETPITALAVVHLKSCGTQISPFGAQSSDIGQALAAAHSGDSGTSEHSAAVTKR